jgi:CRISPR-associated endonuclease/helicase Cas3
VAIQVVEAGIDLNAAVLVTEAAPSPSVVQRAGRCIRTGRVEAAGLWWLPPPSPAPYAEAAVKAVAAELEVLEGVTVTSEELLARGVAVTEQPVAVLQRADLMGLFDTAPDLSGGLDIGPHVRDADDLDAQLAWAIWVPEPGAQDGRPPADAKTPPTRWRCRVPLGELAVPVRRAAVWRLDQALGRWTRSIPAARTGPGPGEVLVAAAGAVIPLHRAPRGRVNARGPGLATGPGDTPPCVALTGNACSAGCWRTSGRGGLLPAMWLQTSGPPCCVPRERP